MDEVATASEAASAAVQSLSENYLRHCGTPQPDMSVGKTTDEHRDCSTSSTQAPATSRMATWEPTSTRAYAKFRQLQILKPQSQLPGTAASTPPPASAAPCGAVRQVAGAVAAAGPSQTDQGLLSSRLAAEQARTTRLQTALQESQCLQSYYVQERKHLLLQLQQMQGALQAALCGSGAAGSPGSPGLLGGLGLSDLHPNSVAAAMAAAAESEVGLRVASKQLPPDAAVAALSTSPCDAATRLAASLEQLHRRLSEQLLASGEAQRQLQVQLEQASVALQQQKEAAGKGLAQQRGKYHARLLQLRKACTEEASQLQAQVSQLQQLMQQSSSQQQQLEQQLGQAAHREAVSQQVVADLKRQLAAESAAQQAATQRLQQLQGEHHATSSQLSSLQQQHEQLSSALTTATEQLEEAAEQLTTAEDRIQTLEAAHHHSSASATEQATAAAQARIQLRKAKDAAKQAAVGAAARNEQLSVLKSKAAQAAQQVAAARAAAKEAAQQLAVQQQVCGQQATALEETRQELATVRRAAAAAGRERQAEAARASAAEASAAAAQAAAAASEAACQLLQKQADALQQQLAAAEALSGQYKLGWQQQQEAVGSLQRQVAAYKKEVLQKQRQLVEATRQLKAVKQQAAVAVQELDGVREDVEIWNILKRQTYSRGGSPAARQHSHYHLQQQQRRGMLSEHPWASPPSTSCSGVAAAAADVLMVHDAHTHPRASGPAPLAFGSSSRVRRSSQVSSSGVLPLGKDTPGNVWDDAGGRGDVFKQALQLDELLQDKEAQLQVALLQVQQLEGLVGQLEQQLEDAQQQVTAAAGAAGAAHDSSGVQPGGQDLQQLRLQLAVAQAQLQQERCQAQLREQELLGQAKAAQEEAAQLRARLQQLQQLLDCSRAAAAAGGQSRVAGHAFPSNNIEVCAGGMGDAGAAPEGVPGPHRATSTGSTYLAGALAAPQQVVVRAQHSSQAGPEERLSAHTTQHTVPGQHGAQDPTSRRSQVGRPTDAAESEQQVQQERRVDKRLALKHGAADGRRCEGVGLQQQQGQVQAAVNVRSSGAARERLLEGLLAYLDAGDAGAGAASGGVSDASSGAPTDRRAERPAAVAGCSRGTTSRQSKSGACTSFFTPGLKDLGGGGCGTDQESDMSNEHSAGASSSSSSHGGDSSDGDVAGVGSEALYASEQHMEGGRASHRTKHRVVASRRQQQQETDMRGESRALRTAAASKSHAVALSNRLTGTARLLKAQQQAQLVAAAAAAPVAAAGGGLRPASYTGVSPSMEPGQLVLGTPSMACIGWQQQQQPNMTPGAAAGMPQPVPASGHAYAQQQWHMGAFNAFGAGGFPSRGGTTPLTGLPLAAPAAVQPTGDPTLQYVLTQGSSGACMAASPPPPAATAAALVGTTPSSSGLGLRPPAGWDNTPPASSSSNSYWRPGMAAVSQPIAGASCDVAGLVTPQLGHAPTAFPLTTPTPQHIDVGGGVGVLGGTALAAEVEEALQAAQAALAASSQS